MSKEDYILGRFNLLVEAYRKTGYSVTTVYPGDVLYSYDRDQWEEEPEEDYELSITGESIKGSVSYFTDEKTGYYVTLDSSVEPWEWTRKHFKDFTELNEWIEVKLEELKKEVAE